MLVVNSHIFPASHSLHPFDVSIRCVQSRVRCVSVCRWASAPPKRPNECVSTACTFTELDFGNATNEPEIAASNNASVEAGNPGVSVLGGLNNLEGMHMVERPENSVSVVWRSKIGNMSTAACVTCWILAWPSTKWFSLIYYSVSLSSNIFSWKSDFALKLNVKCYVENVYHNNNMCFEVEHWEDSHVVPGQALRSCWRSFFLWSGGDGTLSEDCLEFCALSLT